MSRQSDRAQIDEFVSGLQNLEWRVIRLRLGAAIDRAYRGGHHGADGFPRTASGGSDGGGGSGATIGVKDESGQVDRVPVTGTEATFFAQEEARRGRGEQDSVKRLALSAMRHFGNALLELRAGARDLDEIDRITAGDPVESPYCEVSEPAGVKVAWDHRGTVGGRLTKVMALCDPVIRFVEKHGRVPTGDEVRHHDATGSWKVRVDPTKETSNG